MGLRAAALAIAFLAALPAAAQAAPKPFGHDCRAENGVRFCPTETLEQRVPSFDGTLIDVDVTLPPEGDGPWPTIVMIHGWGGSKTSFEQTKAEGDDPDSATLYHYNNVHFAQRGYAVVNHTARGWGRSCAQSSNTGAGCENGYIHLADQRFEVRDIQHLLGLLVDEGIAVPDRLGATGISYGGGQSTILAFLRDRIRNPDESFAPWRSPKGAPMKLAAAWPKWLWSDLVYSLLPNGRYLDFELAGPENSREPLGVPIETYISGLYASGNVSGRYAPPGSDPDADLTSWYSRVTAGEPFTPDARAIADEIFEHHQGFGLSGPPAPLLLNDGWTDDLFTPAESLRVYNQVRAADPRAMVALQFADLGHDRGQNKVNADRFLNDQGTAFLDRHVRGIKSPADPAPGEVTVFTQTCPADAPAEGPFAAPTWPEIHPGAVRHSDSAAKTFTSAGGNPETGRQLDPIAGGGACTTVAASDAPNSATYRLPAAEKDFLMIGRPTVNAKVATIGPHGQIAARLWDVGPDGRQTLVTRGVYRLYDNQQGQIVFQLNGNGYRFAKGHVPKLELLGRDAPYLRPSNGEFTVTVSDLSVELPVYDRPNGKQIRPATVRGPGRVKPRVKFTVSPKRDASGPRRFRVRGKVIRPRGISKSRGCKGRVSVQWKAGKNTISNRRAKVRSNCKFRKRVTFRQTSRFRGKARLKVVVRFLGNQALDRRKAKRRYVRVR